MSENNKWLRARLKEAEPELFYSNINWREKYYDLIKEFLEDLEDLKAEDLSFDFMIKKWEKKL